MVANSKPHAVSQTAYAGADGNLYAVWEKACDVKGLTTVPHCSSFLADPPHNPFLLLYSLSAMYYAIVSEQKCCNTQEGKIINQIVAEKDIVPRRKGY